MLKKFLWSLSVVAILCSCSSDGEDIPSNPEQVDNSITILAYMVANNDLDSDLLTNVGAMYDGLADMDVPATLFVYWDGMTGIGKNGATHLILKYQTDGKGKINGKKPLDSTHTVDDVLEEAEIVKEYPVQLSTDKNVMKTVLNDMASLSSTERLGLVVGSHGSSWLSSIKFSRSFGQDGIYSENTIKMADMVEAVSSVGKKFEFLLFDACYMGSVEVCYGFRNITNYQIVSPMEIPAYGFPYDLLMKHLYKGTVNGYKQVCQSYIDYYKQIYDKGSIAWGTIALIDSKEMQSLTNLIKQEIVGHKDILATYDVSASGLQEYGRRNSGLYIGCDLEHFVKDLNGGNIPVSFKSQLEKTILYKGALEKARYSIADYDVDINNYCGLGLYIPVVTRPLWNNTFKTIDWYTAAGWNEVTFSWNF